MVALSYEKFGGIAIYKVFSFVFNIVFVLLSLFYDFIICYGIGSSHKVTPSSDLVFMREDS